LTVSWRRVIMPTHMAKALIERLLNSEEPSVRWKVRHEILGEDAGTTSMRARRL
jgi:hypothetical protein